MTVPIFNLSRFPNQPSCRHIHRADLHRGLLECATDLGIELHMDSRVLEVDPYTPSLTTKGGRTYTADLIVASDGNASRRQEQQSNG